ncbi:MAG: hypothetical protein PF484_11215 [Bacteroidales bacterium]|jgi:hypothetical protein|nr:hypothetical protein [Bacteroidales bacterium]
MKLEKLHLVKDALIYNLKIVFGSKFIYFLIAAVAFYLMIIGIMLFDDDAVQEFEIYNTILFPGILVIFYPVIFSIQNDKDARMLEIIFGVPNYRYKVYLLRFAISLLLLFVILLLMSWFAVFALVKVHVFYLSYQLMYPLLFIAGVAFFFSTWVKNANATAVIMVIIGLFFFILAEPLEYSKWNIFLNPLNTPSNLSHTVWQNVINQNRLMLIIVSVIAILGSMVNLQRREKFV